MVSYDALLFWVNNAGYSSACGYYVFVFFHFHRELCWCMISQMRNHLTTSGTGSGTLRRWETADAGENKHEVFISFCESVIWIHFCLFNQHASSDVERMVLGNKCDMNDKRQVSKEKGEKVCIIKKKRLLKNILSKTNLDQRNCLNKLYVKCWCVYLNSSFFLLLLQLAIDYGIKFLETSAKSSTNVEEVGENCLMLI